MISIIYSILVSFFFILKFVNFPIEIAKTISYFFYFFYIVTFFILLFSYKDILSVILQKFDILILNFYLFISALFLIPSHEARVYLVHFLGLCFVALLVSILWRRNKSHGIVSIYFVFALLEVVSLYVSVVYPEIGINYEGRWMGVTNHPNSLGVISLITIWICLLSFVFQKKRIISCSLIAFLFIVSCINMFMSDSKTSMMLSIFIILFIIFLKNFYFCAIKILNILLLIIFLFLLVFKAFNVGFHDYYLSFFEMIGREPTFTGRTYIWRQAIDYIEKSPVFGFGLGVGSDIVVTNHYHNGYLQTLVRLGWVGFILLCLSFFNLIYFSFYSKKDVLLNVSCVSFFAVMLLHNITESTFLVHSSPMWAMFLIIYFSFRNNRKFFVHEYN